MAALGSVLRHCREDRGWGHADVAARLIQQGFVSQHFRSHTELTHLLSAIENGGPCVWQCEEAVDFQLYCLGCFGVPGMRISVALSAERPTTAPVAGMKLRDCRVHHHYSPTALADLLVAEGMESSLFEVPEDLADILSFMDQGALCPFTLLEAGHFVAALRGALGDDCASEIGFAMSTDLLRQILPEYW